MKPPNAASSETTLGQDLRHLLRYYLGGRRGVIALAVVVLIAGAVLNWSWLVAAGIAPVLLTLLPCAAMCALGLCMRRLGGQSCSTGKDSKADSAAARIAANAEQSESNDIAGPATREQTRPEPVAGGHNTDEG